MRVGDAKSPGGLSPAEQRLRVQWRAHGRQLGDRLDPRGGQTIDRLVAECAYEHWHRMLFARFLAETELLIEPESGLPISLADCQELARERGEDWLALASSFAVRMLPKIFRPDDPVLRVALPPETRSALEDQLKSLPSAVFTADDSLGWVYQFWQADEKERVNASGTKIGAEELPAVTQLFTEDYMVLFLLHNTLGAWWAGKVLASVEQASSLAPDSLAAGAGHNRDGCATDTVEQASSLAPLGSAEPDLHKRDAYATSATSEAELRAACRVGDIEWTYLRFVREDDGRWRPAAGTFEGWPKTAREITLLDPCMGSGHFLVFALPILVALRMAEEGLSRPAAVDAVLRDNLHGLEIDPRCTQIAAFNLALAAWKLSSSSPSVAQASRLCPVNPPSSVAPPPQTDQAGTLDLRLPELQLACSGLTPAASEEEWLALAEQSGLKLTAVSREPIMNGLRNLHALFSEAPTLGSLIDPNQLSRDLLTADYETLKPYLAAALATEHTDDELHERAVAAAGMVKAAELLAGEYTLVITNVPYLGRGKQNDVLKRHIEEHFVLGKADLATAFALRCVDLSEKGGTAALVTPQNWLFLTSYRNLREYLLENATWSSVVRLGARAFDTISGEVVNVALLTVSGAKPNAAWSVAGFDATSGQAAAEKASILRGEIAARIAIVTQADQSKNPDATVSFDAISGDLLSEHAISTQGLKTGDDERWRRQFWEVRLTGTRWRYLQSSIETTMLYGGRDSVIDWQFDGEGMARLQGMQAWGRAGVAVKLMGSIPATLYSGEAFDSNVAPITPKNAKSLAAMWTFCEAGEFSKAIRRLNSKLNIAEGSVVKVPFDLAHWQTIAAEKYPQGLPEPESDDPTQWLFHGRPEASTAALQVAVARLLGYRWPAELAVEQASSLAPLGSAGQDAHNRDGCATSAVEQASPLAQVGSAEPDAHKRDAYATTEHKRDACATARRTLEKLIYTYLGDWIDEQRRQQQNSVDGAEARLAAAIHLQGELEKILHGEPPCDLFVRWKPLHEQPIGWEPDINDGVRLNIRPFMTARPLGARARNACILRVTPKSIKWDADRGKEPHREKEDFPWFWSWDGVSEDFTGGGAFDGKRFNGLHYSVAMKQAARDRRASVPLAPLNERASVKGGDG